VTFQNLIQKPTKFINHCSEANQSTERKQTPSLPSEIMNRDVKKLDNACPRLQHHAPLQKPNRNHSKRVNSLSITRKIKKIPSAPHRCPHFPKPSNKQSYSHHHSTICRTTKPTNSSSPSNQRDERKRAYPCSGDVEASNDGRVTETENGGGRN
jgi:hypothetical protein